MWKKLVMLSTTLLMLSVTSCAPNTTETAPRAISEYCLVAKGITFSAIREGQIETAENKYDTAETVQQVRDHDLAYERLCNKDQ